MKTVINHLSNLTSLFIGSPIQDPSIRLSPTMITGLLREHPLLEELIFVRVFIIKEPSNPPKIPHPLYNLKRLAFYHCESAAIQTIVAAIPHTYGLSIVVNTVADWGKYVKLSAARSLIAKTVPKGRDGYTDAFVSGFTTKSMQINLSGPGVAYSIIIPAEHWTAHTILHGLANSGHFAHLQRLCVRGLAYTVLEADWLRSASNLSFLTVQCTMVMWHRPRWMDRLFESLPSSLGELQILVCPDEDVGIAKNNCQRLLALNRERMQPLHIYLKIYDALFRKKSTFVIYDHFRNEDRHVSVEPWDLYQTHRELLGEHLHNECDISPHHKYWPSWFEEDFTYCPVRHHDGLDDYMW
ncbi:hypothetical protein QCA50_018675 [Cerrena zonata]|uniref:Uncharacterized protein n=1 Tax=Cerrena zonata TaxID=2478898 RepID=A0AAW0FM58_9APHY